MNDQPPQQGELILYRTARDAVRVEVLNESETFWLDQKRMAELFGVDVRTVSEHLRNVYDSGELNEEATLRKIRRVRAEGNREVARDIVFYNLDAIISVGYLRHLSAKLPRRKRGSLYQFDDEVRLEYYRLQKISEGSISLAYGTPSPLDGPKEVGSGISREVAVPLSQLIDLVNERFGTDFNQADQFFFDQIVEAAVGDDGLRQAAAVNPEDRFELVFRNLLERLFVERMDQNEDIFVRYMNDGPFRDVVSRWMASEAYRRLKVPHDQQIEEAEGAQAPIRYPE